MLGERSVAAALGPFVEPEVARAGLEAVGVLSTHAEDGTAAPRGQGQPFVHAPQSHEPANSRRDNWPLYWPPWALRSDCRSAKTPQFAGLSGHRGDRI